MQLRLVMHGIPRDLVKHATVDQLRVLQEVVNRDISDELKLSTGSVANGIGTAFGGK